MKLDSRWMWIGGVLAAAVLALVAGITPGTLLIVAALLACPAAMYFGMRGHQSASGMPPGRADTRRAGGRAAA